MNENPKIRFIALLWLLVAVVSGSQSWYFYVSAGREVPWRYVVFAAVCFSSLWLLLTPLIIALAKRFPLERRRWLSLALLHLFFAALVAFVQLATYNALVLLAQASSKNPFTAKRVFQLVVANYDYGILVYCVILFIHRTWDNYEKLKIEQLRAAQLQAELATAQLQALKSQLHPHFLFNTLNTIAVLIREDPHHAGRLVELLSDLLRHTLKTSTEQEVALQQELALLQLYLDIEQTRFGERLSIRMSVAPDTLAAKVPNFILQPLVENAIRHGIAKRRGLGVIEINAARKNGELHLEVRDNGYGLAPNDESKKTGIGLRNTCTRLQTLYGEKGVFTLAPIDGGGARAEIVIPFRERS